MIVQVFEMYSDDCDCNDYEEGELIRVGKDAVRARYAILDDPDQDCWQGGLFRRRIVVASC